MLFESDINSILINLEETAIFREVEVKLAALVDKLPLRNLSYFNRTQVGKRLLYVNDVSPSCLVTVMYKKPSNYLEYTVEFISFLETRDVKQLLHPLGWFMPSGYENYLQAISEEDEIRTERTGAAIFNVRRKGRLFSVDKPAARSGRFAERSITHYDWRARPISVDYYVREN